MIFSLTHTVGNNEQTLYFCEDTGVFNLHVGAVEIKFTRMGRGEQIDDNYWHIPLLIDELEVAKVKFNASNIKDKYSEFYDFYRNCLTVYKENNE